MENQFPASDFDDWAESYDNSVLIDQYPFLGYQDVLRRIIVLAEPRPGLSILDLGTGTANLASLFAREGCELWCTDFSEPMLTKARQKLPEAHFLLHDLHTPLPPALERPFDRIISAYVFHHFELVEKASIIQSLASRYLAPGGWIVIGDVAFQNRAALEKFKIEVGKEWEEEYYWLADETIPVLAKIGIRVEYQQVSPCAGVFILRH